MTVAYDPYVRPDQPIERDEIFMGWTRALPRLWYLDQRQATRLDAESLYGATQFAIFQSRTVDEVLPEVVDTGQVVNRKYLRTIFDSVPFAHDAVSRTITIFRTYDDAIPVVEDTGVVVRPSTSPVSPIVHNIPADEG